jgi:hypothetical protein
MKRIRVQRPKPRKEGRYDTLALGPCDPDILRAKQLMYGRSQHEGGGRA